MSSLSRRVGALESGKDAVPYRPFIWKYGQPLADALGEAGLTLEDQGLFAIRFVSVGPDRLPVPDPVYERDRHLLA